MGNPVYYVGPGTGRDGLGGAIFAARELTEESAAALSSVNSRAAKIAPPNPSRPVPGPT